MMEYVAETSIPNNCLKHGLFQMIRVMTLIALQIEAYVWKLLV